MKSNRLLSAGFGLVLCFSLLLLTTKAIAAPNTNGITNTRHNLMTPWSAMSLVNAFNKYGEVCVYCHTPHGATTDAPLWNRTLPATGGYTPYSSSTIDTNIGQPDGVSLACLSCHDGTIAVDAVRNAPGSGTNLTGWSTNHYALAQTGQSTSGNGTCLQCHGESAGILSSSMWFDVMAFSQNLGNQHPISMNYPTATQDPAFNQTFTYNGKIAWFEETNNSRADDNEIKLYSDGAGGYKVQCATCHNPHGTLSSDGVNLYPTFLRKSNSNSAICTTCHIK
ncbi:MAG: hypothetical protein HZA06_05505 [Nitrospirae bacterium]|nr:hypothetical protein [Nitrospirota bacterium]